MPSASERFSPPEREEQTAGNAVRRPAIPPVLQVGLGVWAGCACAYWAFAGKDAIAFWPILLGSVSAALCCAGVLLHAPKQRGTRSRLRRKAACLLCLGLALGCASGVGGAAVYLHRIGAWSGASGTVTLMAIEDMRTSAYRTTVVCRIVACGGDRVIFGPKVSATLPEGTSVMYGDFVSGETVIRAPSGTSDWYATNAIVGICTLTSVQAEPGPSLLSSITGARKQIVDAIEKRGGDASASPDAASVLEALVCGYRTNLFAEDVYDSFKTAGVGHLVAVSGAHLSVMFALLTVLLRLLRVRRRPAIALQVGGLLLYLLFSAIPISALRAAVMVGLGIVSLFAKRRPAVLNALGVCIICVVVIRPEESLSASFLLSATSTLGIVLFSGLASLWIKTLLPMLPKALADALALTTAATMLSLPFSIALFSQCSLITLLSNLVAAPLFTLVCGFGLLAALLYLMLPGIGIVLLQVALSLAQVLCYAVGTCASIPFACIPATMGTLAALVLTLSLGSLLWMLWPRPDRRGVAVVLAASCLVCGAVFLGTLPQERIVMLDVGQGDAILVQSGGRSMLIDTGNQPALLKQALARSHIAHLDGVIITHPDDDHCAALSDLAGVCVIDAVYVARDLIRDEGESCRSFRMACERLDLPLYGLSQGDSLQFGSMTCRVVWPHAYADSGGNADSLCLLVEAHYGAESGTSYRLLFTGDAGEDELEQMIAAQLVGDIDILKVGHHGSRTALYAWELDVLRPEVALISVGAGNRYGHPADEILSLLMQCGCTVYRTDSSGDITVKLSRKGVTVTTQR